MKAQKVLLIMLAAAVLAGGAADAKGARMGGGMRMAPSITRPAAPKTAPKQAAPVQKTTPAQQAAPAQKTAPAKESGAKDAGQKKQAIDEGIDPKDYGKKNVGTGTAPAGTSSGFFGSGGFFRGFSLWPWMWFGSMNHSAAAEDGGEAETAQQEEPSWWESLWASICSFFGFVN